MSNQRIYLSPPHMSGLEIDFVNEAFRSNWIAPLGPNVDCFEKELSDYVGVRGAVALNSGTSAIHLALRLLGVGSGDVVFCSTLTFVASANPINYLGAKPVFIDSEPETWNMSPLALRKAFDAAARSQKLPKAVIVVNLYGQSADYDSITEICNSYEVPIIEDAAESLGATYRGKPSGSFGKFGVFSFNGNKIITTSGGGMLVSNDLDAISKARYWSTQARDQAKHYQHSEIGYNYRLSNVLAGIGRGQLSILNDRISRRREIFKRYFESLSTVPGISFMPEAEKGYSTRWLTTFLIDYTKSGVAPGDLIDQLENHNIEARPVWKPLHLQPLFDGCEYYSHGEHESISEKLFSQGICVPSGTNMTEDDLLLTIEVIRSTLKSRPDR